MAQPNDGTVAKRIQGKRKSIESAAAAHEKASKERADKIKTTKAAYMAEKDGPVIADLLEKAETFRQYHLKLAQDGVGARKTGHKLVDGSEEVENFFLTNNQRAGHLDKASGIQELIDYIERQVTIPAPPPAAKQ